MNMLRDLSNVLRTASLCGLGQIAPAPIQSVMKNFPEIMREHIEDKYCSRRHLLPELRERPG